MNTCHVRCFAICCAVIALMVSSRVTVAADDNDLMKRIVNHWREQQGQVRSVRYVMVAEAMIPKGRYSGDIPLPPAMLKKEVPAKDYRYEVRLSWTIDFENNRMRKEYIGQTFYLDKGAFTSEDWIHVFDGSTTKRYFSPEVNTSKGSEDADLGVVNNGNTVETGSYDDPVFFAHGFIPSVRHAINEAGRIPPLDLRSVQLMNRAVLNGTECVVLKITPSKDQSEPHNELWAELGGGGRILRKDLWSAKELLSRVDVEYEGVLPAKWVATEFSQGKITLEQRFTVKEVEKNPPLDSTLFDIKLRPGLRVRKVDANNISDDKEYLVGKDGKTLIEWKKRGQQPVFWFSAVLTGILIVGIILSVLWLSRRWKSRKLDAEIGKPHTHEPEKE